MANFYRNITILFIQIHEKIMKMRIRLENVLYIRKHISLWLTNLHRLLLHEKFGIKLHINNAWASQIADDNCKRVTQTKLSSLLCIISAGIPLSKKDWRNSAEITYTLLSLILVGRMCQTKQAWGSRNGMKHMYAGISSWETRSKDEQS